MPAQDAQAGAKERQEGYLTPFVIRPFVDRLIALGVLPTPEEGYIVFWPDLGTQTGAGEGGGSGRGPDAMVEICRWGRFLKWYPLTSFLSSEI